MKKLHTADLDEIINNKPVDIAHELVYKKRFTFHEMFIIVFISQFIILGILILSHITEMI